MRLIRRVQDAATDVGAEMPLARAQQRVERCRRSTGGEQSARLSPECHPLTQPVEGVCLQLHHRRRALPHAGVTVDGVGDEIGERGWVDAAARYEREIAGPRRRERPWNARVE